MTKTKRVSGPVYSSSVGKHIDTACYAFQVPAHVTSRSTETFCNTDITYEDREGVAAILVHDAVQLLGSQLSGTKDMTSISSAWKNSRRATFRLVSEKDYTLGGHPAHEMIEVDRGSANRYSRTVVVDSGVYYLLENPQLKEARKYRIFLLTGNNDDSTGSRQTFSKVLETLRWK